ncbi:hypothetical protein ACNS7O_13380 [Haloferacaceae archaeon DSL9]
MDPAPESPVYLTDDLATVLLEFAEEREPARVTVPLAATPAASLDADLPIDPATPVITHFYLPGAAGSVQSVFGVDLGTPAGGTRARFVSHPSGPLSVTKEDDLAAVIIVAMPPWEPASLAAFDRSGRRLPLELIDAAPPEESIH